MKRILSATLFVAVLGIIPITAFAQSESRDDVIKQIETKRAELSALEKKLLSPSEEDRTAYAGFVGQHDKGLIRLLPREVYDKEHDPDRSRRWCLLFVYSSNARLRTRLGHRFGTGLSEGRFCRGRLWHAYQRR